MTRKGIALASALALASLMPACRAAPLMIELPKHDGAKALIVAIEHGTLDVMAIDPAQAPATLPFVELAGGASATMVMLGYPDQTLDDMGLDPGPLEAAAEGDPSTLALDAFRFAGKSVVFKGTGPVGPGDDGDGDGWNTLPALDDTLRAFKPHTRRFARCLRFEAATYPLGASLRVPFGIPLDETHSLLVSSYDSPQEQSHLFVATATGVTRTSLEITDFFPYAAAGLGDGEVWLAGGSSHAGSRIWHGHPDRRGFQFIPRPVDPVLGYWIRGLQVSRTGTRTVVSYAADTGTFGTWDGAWHTIVSLGVPIDEYEALQGNNLATSGDEAWFVLSWPKTSASRRIAHVKGTRLLDPIDIDRPLSAIAYVPALGKLITGDDTGEIFALENGRLKPLASTPPRTFGIYAITPTEDGFLFGASRDTRIGQYVDGFGYCPPGLQVGLRTVQRLVPLGAHRYVAIGQPLVGHDGAAVVLTPR